MKEIEYNNFYWQNELVRLRAMLESDWELHYHNRFDSSARLLLNYEIELPPTTKESIDGTNKYTNFTQTHGRIMFIIETLDGTAVGSVNLNSINERNGTFSIGMVIYCEYRGKGYGTAAMKIILDYAFNQRRLNKYYGSTIQDNIASQTMLQKLGCKKEGVRKEMIYANGKYYDEILFGLTKNEYINFAI